MSQNQNQGGDPPIAEKAPAKKAKQLEIVVVRGTIHHGAAHAQHARDRKVTEHGPGSRVKLPEDEAKALIERGMARLPDAPAKAEAAE